LILIDYILLALESNLPNDPA
jgi:hypothetical protein